MKKILLFLFLVLLVGIGGWALGYCLSTAQTPRPTRNPEAMLLWLRQEYHLDPGQYAAVRKLHDEYLPQARELSLRRDRAYEALKALMSPYEGEDSKAVSDTYLAKVFAAAREYVAAKEAVRANYNQHINAVAAAMSPDESERFLETVKNKIRE